MENIGTINNHVEDQHRMIENLQVQGIVLSVIQWRKDNAEGVEVDVVSLIAPTAIYGSRARVLV